MITARAKYVLRVILRNLIKIFSLFPIKSRRILFTVLDGENVYDSPRNIYDFLTERYSDQYEYVWIYNRDRKDVNFPESVKVVERHTLKWIYFMMTSKVIVDDWPPSLIIPSRKNQLYLETWHAGGAYKTVGSAVATAEKKFQKKKNEIKIRTVNTFVSSSREFTKSNIEKGYQFKGEILKSGLPRNDIFFNDHIVQENENKIKQFYSLHGIIALYAPTFRGNVNKAVKLNSVLDLERLQRALESRYCCDVNILVRCHPVDQHSYNFGENVIDVSDYKDMQELLCAADILITDYSSCMWDFALLGRPCLLYTPDIDLYIKDRGLFTSPEDWPGIICRNGDELCNEIKNLDEDACAVKAKHHLELMGSYETGHATEIVSNRIVNYMNGEQN